MARDLYLALGDSITAGHGATHPSLTFVRRVSEFVREQSFANRTLVFAKNGWTAKDVWRASMSISPATWAQTNVLTLMAGGNDLRRLLRGQLLSRAPITPAAVIHRLQEFHFHMERLCDHVSRQDIPHVLVATVYNPVPNSDFAAEAMQSLNKATRDIAGHYHFEVVDVFKRFQHQEAYYINGYRMGRMEDLASPVRRPIHPNNAGHREIADLITAQLSTKVRQRKVSRRLRQGLRGSKINGPKV